jgi:serine/threonine protein kinase
MKDEQVLHPSLERLSAFDSGRLRDAEWDEIERHVAHCATCCSELEALPEDNFAALLRASAGKSTAPPSCESKQTPAGSAVNSADTLPRRAKATAPDIPPELATHPRYRILELLGSGGMGTVFKAEHRLMERVVALKIIRKDLMDRPAAIERFPQEVRAAARLIHPHIVTAYDAEQAGDVHFLVMEYVEGKSLDRLLAQSGRIPVDQACDWVHQAALGLQHAWEQGMVHRDIKPGNLLLTPGGQVKILDFGLARFANETAPGGGLTLEGSMVGTPDYMAPEQAEAAGKADIRADIYSLGCTLYHLLAGEPPFPEGAPLHKLVSHQTRQPRPLTELRADVTGDLAQVVQRMLAKDPAQRYQTPAEVARELVPFAAGEWPTVPLKKAGHGTVPLPSASKEIMPAAQSVPQGAVVPRFRGRSWRVATTVALLLVGVGLLGSIVGHFSKHAPSAGVGGLLSSTATNSPNLGGPVVIAPPELARPTGPQEAATVGEIRCIGGQMGPFTCAAFSSDCRQALVAGADFTLHLWDLEKGEEMARLAEHPVWVLGLTFSPDGKRALSSHGRQNLPEGTIGVWDLQERRLLRIMKGHRSWVRGVQFLPPDARYALSGSNDANLLFWDTHTGDPLKVFKGHVAPVGGVAVSRFGRFAASSGWDNTVRLWDLLELEPQELRIYRGHEDAVPTLVYSFDGRYLLSGSQDKTLRLWDAKTERPALLCFKGHTGPVNSVALSTDNRWALSGSTDHTVRLWNMAQNHEQCCFKGHTAAVLGVAFCPGGLQAVSASEDGTFRIWQLPPVDQRDKPAESKS